MIKSLISHGNSSVLVIDKAVLQAPGLDDKTLFQVAVDPNGGILIRSARVVNDGLHNEAFKLVLKENDTLMKKLSKR